jgi:ubiquinone/menaquinone biosynthesis C-methylase UbiE
MSTDAATTAIRMRTLYDSYFSSSYYRQRYPVANPATLQFLLDNGATQAASILDVGCGDGRYAVALLDKTTAKITGSDISSSAINEFGKRLQDNPQAFRVNLVHGTVNKLKVAEPFDLVLLLFGVLSHAGNRTARIAMLKEIRRLTASDGQLLLTVPSAWRRKPTSLINSIPEYFKNPGAGFGDIEYSRQIAGKSFDFFYHLYTVKRLKSELQEAGWATGQASAESILPEKYVTHYPWLAKIDGALSTFIPASLGYGIRIVAKPMAERATSK